MKHTSGPWETLTFSNHELQTDFAMVKIGDRVHMIGYSEEDKANARLIAAALDLLSAAKLGLSVAESWIDQEYGGERFHQAHKVLDPIRTAIAKATGETP